MNRDLIRRWFGSGLTLMALTISVGATELKGTVRNMSGAPLPGVSIFERGANFKSYEVKTDETGNFTLPEVGRVLFIRHPLYRPATKIVNADQSNIEIVLEDPVSSDLHLTNCSTLKVQEQLIGFDVKVALPKGFKGIKGHDIDYEKFFVYKSGHKNDGFEIWFGPTVSSGYVDDDTILRSSVVSDRYVRADEGVVGIESSGTLGSGAIWRHIEFFMGLIRYSTSSPQLARAFDQVIDGMCVDTHFWDK